MKLLTFLLFAITLTMFVACNDKKADATDTSSSFNLDSVRAQIAASNVKYGHSFSLNDSTGFLSCYTSDACINPPNMARICGPGGINAFFTEGVKWGIRDLKLTTEEVTGGKEGVAETGKYDLLDSAGKSLDKGKFIVIWKEENGQWKMHRDEWNSDIAMPAAK